MKTISVAVFTDDYEAFRRAARQQHRPIAQLIREAMAAYRGEELEKRTPIAALPTYPGVHLIEALELPDRDEVYSELAGRHRLASTRDQE